MDSVTWILFDIMGTIAFAVSGAMVGIMRRMDIFGIIVLALLTAIGGGVVRDVLAAITPPTALRNITDFTLALLTALLVIYIYTNITMSRPMRARIQTLYNLNDTIGLAAFTVTGMITGLTATTGNPIVFPVLLGVITAVGGGILRDLMAERMPVVLYKDFYATASLLGALIACPLAPIIGLRLASWLCFILVVGLRLGALHYGWRLLRPTHRKLRPRPRTDGKT